MFPPCIDRLHPIFPSNTPHLGCFNALLFCWKIKNFADHHMILTIHRRMLTVPFRRYGLTNYHVFLGRPSLPFSLGFLTRDKTAKVDGVGLMFNLELPLLHQSVPVGMPSFKPLSLLTVCLGCFCCIAYFSSCLSVNWSCLLVALISGFFLPLFKI